MASAVTSRDCRHRVTLPTKENAYHMLRITNHGNRISNNMTLVEDLDYELTNGERRNPLT